MQFKQKFVIYEKRKKERECPLTNFKQIIRQSVRKSFKRNGYTKKSKTYGILGNDWETVKKHFEFLFQPGMSWDNHGEWEIDHIIPLSSGKTEEDVIKLCHYKNLQPLWKEDNRKKGNKLPDKTPSN